MPDQLPLFEVHLRQRRRSCRWYVCTIDGQIVMHGAEGHRTAARYQANRALFLLLLGSASRPTLAALPPRGRARRSRSSAD